MAQLYPFWRRVHMTEPAKSPALPELLAVLAQLDIHPKVTMLRRRPRTFPNQAVMGQQMLERLGVVKGSEEGKRLDAALDALVNERDGAFSVKGAAYFHEALISWRPSPRGT
jgi:hypothetical protein